MLPVKLRNTLQYGLVLPTILAGCQFHVTLGPVDSQPLPVADHPRSVSQADSLAVIAETRTAAISARKIADTEIAGTSVPVADPVQQTSGWRATVGPVTDSGVTRTSAARTAARGGHLSTAAAAHLPVPVPPAAFPAVNPVPSASMPETAGDSSSLESYPINLAAAHQLAGGESWDVQLASEKVREAHRRLDAARALWLPSLVAGIGYTKHDGQIQNTSGDIIDVSRNSFFVGGGALSGTAPVTGGAGGPARLFVDLSLADAIFKPLVARQTANAEQFRHTATYNDTLQDTSLAYFELIRSQGQLAIARQDLKHAQQLVSLTEAFVSSGKGSRADRARARTEESTRRQLVVQARLQMQIASAELARILRLNPETTLFAIEEQPLPLEFLDTTISLSEYITTGLHQRPELFEAQSRLEASGRRVHAEQLRPFIPHLSVGASAGGFGGGVDNELQQLDGRSDFDVIAVWQLKNLGFGTQAAIETSESQYQSAHYRLQRLRDQITTEIIQMYHAVAAQRERITLAETSVQEALESLDQNNARIRGLEGLPLEALQSVQAVAQANADWLNAIVDFNQAQVRMLRAIGHAPAGEGQEQSH